MRESTEKEEYRRERAKARTRRVAWTMAAFLLLGTVLEYIIAVNLNQNVPIMVAMNLLEAAAIAIYFMHVSRAWRSDGREEA